MRSNPVLELQSMGFHLRVPKDGSQPEMVEMLSDFPAVLGRRVAVQRADVEAARHLLHKLSEFGENQRVGYVDAGLDGDVADWYVAAQ